MLKNRHMFQDQIWLHLKENQASPLRLLKLFEVLVPPVPVQDIARKMGVIVESCEIDSDGQLFMDINAGVAKILVNKRASHVRERFTIAHEIGHLMQHHFTTVHRDASGQYEGRIEWEANNYAADLLMPYWMIKFVGPRYKNDPRELAPIFDVSEQAMFYRLKNLGFVPKR